MSLIGNVKMASIVISVSLLCLVDNNNLMYEKLSQNNLVGTLWQSSRSIMDRFITMPNFKFGDKYPVVLDVEVYAYKVLFIPKVSKIQFKHLLPQKRSNIS